MRVRRLKLKYLMFNEQVLKIGIRRRLHQNYILTHHSNKQKFPSSLPGLKLKLKVTLYRRSKTNLMYFRKKTQRWLNLNRNQKILVNNQVAILSSVYNQQPKFLLVIPLNNLIKDLRNLTLKWGILWVLRIVVWLPK